MFASRRLCASSLHNPGIRLGRLSKAIKTWHIVGRPAQIRTEDLLNTILPQHISDRCRHVGKAGGRELRYMASVAVLNKSLRGLYKQEPEYLKDLHAKETVIANTCSVASARQLHGIEINTNTAELYIQDTWASTGNNFLLDHCFPAGYCLQQHDQLHCS
jgi:hypothetical protein